MFLVISDMMRFRKSLDAIKRLAMSVKSKKESRLDEIRKFLQKGVGYPNGSVEINEISQEIQEREIAFYKATMKILQEKNFASIENFSMYVESMLQPYYKLNCQVAPAAMRKEIESEAAVKEPPVASEPPSKAPPPEMSPVSPPEQADDTTVSDSVADEKLSENPRVSTSALPIPKPKPEGEAEDEVNKELDGDVLEEPDKSKYEASKDEQDTVHPSVDSVDEKEPAAEADTSENTAVGILPEVSLDDSKSEPVIEEDAVKLPESAEDVDASVEENTSNNKSEEAPAEVVELEDPSAESSESIDEEIAPDMDTDLDALEVEQQIGAAKKQHQGEVDALNTKLTKTELQRDNYKTTLRQLFDSYLALYGREVLDEDDYRPDAIRNKLVEITESELKPVGMIESAGELNDAFAEQTKEENIVLKGKFDDCLDTMNLMYKEYAIAFGLEQGNDKGFSLEDIKKHIGSDDFIKLSEEASAEAQSS